MPFYEYACQACGHQFETLQKISDDPLKKCPGCGKQKLTKLVSAPSFRLKGSGWYETDFKTKKPETKDENAKADSSSDSKSDSTSDSKSESKSTTKKDKKKDKSKSTGDE